MMERFGTLDNGETVDRVAITGGGLSAWILTWGAVVQDLRLDGHRPPLVLGLTGLSDYTAHSPYFGAIVGRVANRIAGGSYSIDGRQYQADRNFLGRHTLHGGAEAIGRRNWRVANAQSDQVTMEIIDPDGGFPGECGIVCTYRLGGAGALDIELTATADKPTLCNLAHHSYFNLDGGADILAHELQIEADRYLPVDDELIPTGEVAQVAGTIFDFRTPRAIGGGDFTAFDHNYCLSDDRRPLRRVATAYSPASDVEMIASTTEPGVQFYAGHKIATAVPGLTGNPYGAHAGFCLEAQYWPDYPNHRNFPQSVLRPGETYRQTTRYQFAKRTA